MTLVPLYLPLMTDEPREAGDGLIFFGGINVYLQQKSGLFRKTPAWFDRLLDSPTLLKWAADWTGMTDEKLLGELTVSMLSGEQGQQVKELNKLVTWLASEQRPDIVCLSNALLLGMVRPIRRRLGVPIVCSLQGEDAFLDGLPEPYRQRAWSLLREHATEVDAFIAVSRYLSLIHI